jgi:amidase
MATELAITNILREIPYDRRRLGPAKRTSPFASQMLAQGFVCIGKSAMPEFGFNATTEPAHGQPTRNPWHRGFSTGASSGGSAALVAAGVVPIAHANDGGGSIQIPAACCGLVGLKPSRGRLIDNDAAGALPVNIIADGVVTRSVRDTANFYAEAERYYRNPRLPAIGKVEGPSGRPMRIGLVFDSISGHPTDRVTRQVVEDTARTLEDMGHRLEPIPVPVPETFPADFSLYWGMLAFGIRSRGKKMIGPDFDRNKVDGLTLGLDRLFRYVSFTPLANTTGAPAIALGGYYRLNQAVDVEGFCLPDTTRFRPLPLAS